MSAPAPSVWCAQARAGLCSCPWHQFPMNSNSWHWGATKYRLLGCFLVICHVARPHLSGSLCPTRCSIHLTSHFNSFWSQFSSSWRFSCTFIFLHDQTHPRMVPAQQFQHWQQGSAALRRGGNEKNSPILHIEKQKWVRNCLSPGDNANKCWVSWGCICYVVH